MSYDCKIIADSVGPTGSRLTSMVVTFPRFILAEMNTHRQFSRNSASSRAIPTAKLIERVRLDPFIPTSFGQNKPGMQAGPSLHEGDEERAESIWLEARDNAVNMATCLNNLGVHKQHVNRIIEPFMWHTALITSSEWKNFFAQRCHKDAQPEMQTIAYLMRTTMEESVPNELGEGNWHLPFITDEDVEAYPIPLLLQLATARSARVSYLNHDKVRDPEADLTLFKRLLDGNHWSPFEHSAMATSEDDDRNGNFNKSWVQYRKLFDQECVR